MSPRRSQDVHLARHVLEAVAVWLGLMLALYVAYEVVDRLWLDDLPPESREAARLYRVLAMSLTATVVTAVWMLWRRIPSLRRSLAAPAPEPLAAPAPRPRAELAQWFLGLRWVALVVLGAVITFATTGEPHVPSSSVLPLWSATVALLVVDVALLFAPVRIRAHPDSLLALLLLDVLIIAWMLHHAGGLANPFAAFYVFHAVIGAILLDTRRARLTTGAIVLVIAVQAVLEGTSFMEPACVRGMGTLCREPDPMHLGAAGIGLATLALGCAMFTQTLVGALQRERDRLAGARSALLEEREKLSSILGCMADAVIFADTEGSVRMHNPAAAQLWKNKPGAGEDLRVCHNQETWNRLLAKLENPAALEEHPVLSMDGHHYEATYARVADEAGDLLGVVMVARDITERLQAQEWRMREERMAVVGKLAASVAHEINNPLGVISLYAQHAMKRVPEGDPLSEHLDTIRTNATQASKIVRDLLTYARQRPPERRRFDVEMLVEEVRRTLAVEAEHAGLDLVTEVDEAAPGELVGDPDQLRQVLVNLGLNAVDALRNDEGSYVALRVIPDGPGRIAFEVADDGPGLAEEDRSRVFQAFHTTKAEGTGLGLAVAQDITRAHGGTVELRDNEGGGCIFAVRLPVGDLIKGSEAAE